MDIITQHKPQSQAMSSSKAGLRLKDSCDMCSASKVRCNRQKPICIRCEKLGFQCFYSPARRVGRPQGSRIGGELASASSSTRTGAARRSPCPDYSKSKTISKPTHSQNRMIRPRLLSLPEISLSSATGQDGDPSGTPWSAPHANAGINPVDIWTSQLNMATKFSPSYPQDSSFSQDPLRISPDIMSEPAFPPGKALGSSIMADPCESDCTVIANGMQPRLASLNRLLLPPRIGTDAAHMDPGSSESIMGKIATVFKELSTILICPCSEKLEVGLLVTAACITILDIYDAIISRSKSSIPRQHENGSMRNDEGDNGLVLWHNMGSFASASFESWPESDALLIKVMSELGKMATVICQFTQRYRAESMETVDKAILRAVAMSLKSRLQVLRDAATLKLLNS